MAVEGLKRRRRNRLFGHRSGETMKKWVPFVTEHSLLVLLLIASGFLLSIFLVRNLNVEAFPDPAPPIVEIVTIFQGTVGGRG